MSEDEPIGPGVIEPEDLLTPEQRMQAQLDRIEKMLMEILQAVAGAPTGGRGLGH